MSGRFFTTLKVPCFTSKHFFGEADTKEDAEKVAADRFLKDKEVKDALADLAPSLGSVRRWLN